MNRTKRVYSILVKIEPDAGGFYAYAPDLQGVQAWGETFEEAKGLIVDAVFVYLDMSHKHNDPLPESIIMPESRRTARQMEVHTRSEPVTTPQSQEFVFAMA